MFSTYRAEDVELLLKDITGLVEPMGTREREHAIQAGRHYCEMLPIEYEPTSPYLAAYEKARTHYAPLVAATVATAAEAVYRAKKKRPVLVSLARAGTPIGILMKHYLKKRFGANVPHYTISIIRNIGIDENAMRYILARHVPETIQFIDGWTGKGAIQRELKRAIKAYPHVDAGLAVLSDPANVAAIAGTQNDFLIASACLNSTVSGLLSRTFFRRDIIGSRDFHGAAFYKNLRKQDRTYEFINAVEAHFPKEASPARYTKSKYAGITEVEQIARTFSIENINLIKPGIGEATRVLLRRLPWKILVHSLDDAEHLGHLYQLAREKGVEMAVFPLQNYKACGLIQTIADN